MSKLFLVSSEDQHLLDGKIREIEKEAADVFGRHIGVRPKKTFGRSTTTPEYVDVSGEFEGFLKRQKSCFSATINRRLCWGEDADFLGFKYVLRFQEKRKHWYSRREKAVDVASVWAIPYTEEQHSAWKEAQKLGGLCVVMHRDLDIAMHHQIEMLAIAFHALTGIPTAIHDFDLNLLKNLLECGWQRERGLHERGLHGDLHSDCALFMKNVLFRKDE